MYVSSRSLFFFLMIQRPPGSTLTYTLFPSTTLFRSAIVVLLACGKFLRMALAVDLAVRIAIEFGPLCDPLWDHVGRQPLTAHHERSEEHTSELQSLMRISYAVFCLKKNNNTTITESMYH